MNKAKLDTIMFEILTELELNDVKEAVKAEYEKHLFDNLHALFGVQLMVEFTLMKIKSRRQSVGLI